MNTQYGGKPDKVMITRHGQSCSNIMGEAYAILKEKQSPYNLYGNGITNPPKELSKMYIWFALRNISQDPPLNNGGLCELIELYENHYNGFKPDKVYCSSMCRAIQTAMILYPNGGKDGIIHICPWIHETPHGWKESLFSKKARASRDYGEFNELLQTLDRIYKLDDPNILLAYMGNEYTSQKLAKHRITVKLVEHPLLEEHYRDDINVNKFANEILIKDSGDIAVVSHGYTMRAGCKSDQSEYGWCKFFKDISPKVTDVKLTCLESPCIDTPPDSESACRGNCENTYVERLRSGQNISNGGLITVDVTGDIPLKYEGFTLKYPTAILLKNLYEYHFDDNNWEDRDKEKSTFFNCIECIIRNLIYNWKYFAVGSSSHNSKQKAILSDEIDGYCSRALLNKSNHFWNTFNEKIPDVSPDGGYLTRDERAMFLPYLTDVIPMVTENIGGALKRKKKRKNKKKRKTNRKKSKRKIVSRKNNKKKKKSKMKKKSKKK